MEIFWENKGCLTDFDILLAVVKDFLFLSAAFDKLDQKIYKYFIFPWREHPDLRASADRNHLLIFPVSESK